VCVCVCVCVCIYIYIGAGNGAHEQSRVSSSGAILEKLCSSWIARTSRDSAMSVLKLGYARAI
jgi:hypothetical protein